MPLIYTAGSYPLYSYYVVEKEVGASLNGNLKRSAYVRDGEISDSLNIMVRRRTQILSECGKMKS